MNSNFLGIGGGEFVIILIIAILIVGPEKMVELATKLGLMVAKIRRMSNEATKDFREALAIDEMKEVINEVTLEVKDIGQEVRGVAGDVAGIKTEAVAASQELQTVAEGKTVAPPAQPMGAARSRMPTRQLPAATSAVPAAAADGAPATEQAEPDQPETVSAPQAPRSTGKIPKVILDRLGPPTRPNPGEEAVALPFAKPAVDDDEAAAPVTLNDTTVIEKEEDWEPVEIDELQVHETESEPQPVDEESSS